ncbi:MAG: hypothetical protein IJJ26_05085, partial [Victivallales bacterium]|nr:hypothetical protein [Victivallales bacterium]
MESLPQSIARLKAFLASSNQTACPGFQQAYETYAALRTEAARRLQECTELLRQKHTQEALQKLQEPPELFEFLGELQFPELPELVELADLYDWQPLPPIDQAACERLQNALREIDQLRPLLAAFRRIARTATPYEKLQLLRSIHRLDPDNSEWLAPLREAEATYMNLLIGEAQTAIQSQDFPTLEGIQTELLRPIWHVPVPAIVTEKTAKVLQDWREKCAAEEGAAILEEINDAYSSFHDTLLENAIQRWQVLLQTKNFHPTPNQLAQFNEANTYLQTRIAERQKEAHHREALTKTTRLMDQQAPIEQVEQTFAEAEALELPIPEHLLRRVRQYRNDQEQARRTRRFLLALRILCATVVVLFLVFGLGQYLLDGIQERRSASILKALREAGDLEKAQKMLANLEQNHPRIVVRPRLLAERSAIAALAQEHTRKKALFETYLSEIEGLLKEESPDTSTLEAKLEAASKLVHDSSEKERLGELQLRTENLLHELAASAEQRFLQEVSRARQLQSEIETLLSQNKFEQATERLTALDTLLAQTTHIQGLPPDLLQAQATKELLRLPELLQKKLFAEQEIYDVRNNAMDAIVRAKSVNDLVDVIPSLSPIVRFQDIADLKTALEADLAALQPLFQFQATPGAPLPKDNPLRYFQDFQTHQRVSQEIEDTVQSIRNELKDVIALATRRPLFLFAFRDSLGTLHQVYHTGHCGTTSDTSTTRFILTSNKQERVWIDHHSNNQIDIQIAKLPFPNCHLVYPTVLSRQSLSSATAPHQTIAQRLNTGLASLEPQHI